MTVDSSNMAWVRPTRRVHLALSVGMTITGAILIAAGASGGHGAVRPAPVIGRAADSLNGAPGALVPAAPLVHFAPPVTASPVTALPVTAPPVTALPVTAPPVTASPKPDAKPHAKLKRHSRHRAHPSDVSRPMPPASPASLPPHPFKR